jgi:tetratricopeptide (TPR) repeat protein
MAKTGRNDPCPCGSGKKYKLCCLAKDEVAARTVRANQAAASTVHKPGCVSYLIADSEHGADELTEASNAVIDLVNAGNLDAAERAAHDLLARFPDVHDGYDRLGMVCEARGEYRQAAEYYRKVIAFVRAHPNDYDPGFEAVFHKLVDRLDPLNPETPA